MKTRILILAFMMLLPMLCQTNTHAAQAMDAVGIARAALPAVVGIARTDSDEREFLTRGANSAAERDKAEQLRQLRESLSQQFEGDEERFRRKGKGKGGEELRVSGSGFVISKEGLVVTADHVVAGGKSFTLVTQDGKHLPAKVVARDQRRDIAVLKVDGQDNSFATLKLGASSQLQVGEGLLAVGNPFGFTFTVTSGIVSALDRHITADDIGLIQTDAPLNPGNSGGPILNLKGEVIGVGHAIINPAARSQAGAFSIGLGFAVPIDEVKTVLQEAGY